MNVLVIDDGALALDFCLLCERFGHEVKWYVPPTGKDELVGNGYLKRESDWERWMDWADLIFLSDNTKLLRELSKYRKAGYPIFGSSVEGAKLELDREKGQEMFEKHGISIMPFEKFSDIAKAEKYVLANMKRYVCKPCADDNKEMSYVSKSPADMIFMLRRWKELGKIKGDFILQEFVPGIEVAVGGWLGPLGFCDYFCENFEHKKLMDQEKGPNTGEMGTVIKYVELAYSKLAQDLLIPMEQDLISLGITGYVDVATIVDEEGNPRPLEFTVRPGWPTFNIQCALNKGDPVDWMLDLLNGKDSHDPSTDVATGIVLAIPDFPYCQRDDEEVCGFPIYGLPDLDENDFHLCQAQLCEAPAMNEAETEIVTEQIPCTAGTYVLVVTGHGETVEQSIEQAYENIDKIDVPNSPFHRTDIGQRLRQDVPKLQSYGFCESWTFD